MGVDNLTSNVAGQNHTLAPVHDTPSRNPGELPVSLVAKNFRPSR